MNTEHHIYEEKTLDYLPALFGEYYTHVVGSSDAASHQHPLSDHESDDHELEQSLADARLDDPEGSDETWDEDKSSSGMSSPYSKRPTRSFSTADSSRQSLMKTGDKNLPRSDENKQGALVEEARWNLESDEEDDSPLGIAYKIEQERRKKAATPAISSFRKTRLTDAEDFEPRTAREKKEPHAQQSSSTKKPLESITIVAVGRTGEGKSSLLNDILGNEDLEAKAAVKAITKSTTFHTGRWAPLKPFLKELQPLGCEAVVADTPGFLDTDNQDEFLMKGTRREILRMARGIEHQTKGKGVNALCVVFKVHASTDVIRTTLHMLADLLRPHEGFWENIILVFTHADFGDVSYRENKVFLVNELKPALTREFNLKKDLPMVFISTKPHICAYTRGLGDCDCVRANRYHADCRRRLFQQVWERRGDGWKIPNVPEDDTDDTPINETEILSNRPNDVPKKAGRKGWIEEGGLKPLRFVQNNDTGPKPLRFVAEGGITTSNDDPLTHKPSWFVESTNIGPGQASHTALSESVPVYASASFRSTEVYNTDSRHDDNTPAAVRYHNASVEGRHSPHSQRSAHSSGSIHIQPDHGVAQLDYGILEPVNQHSNVRYNSSPANPTLGNSSASNMFRHPSDPGSYQQHQQQQQHQQHQPYQQQFPPNSTQAKKHRTAPSTLNYPAPVSSQQYNNMEGSPIFASPLPMDVHPNAPYTQGNEYFNDNRAQPTSPQFSSAVNGPPSGYTHQNGFSAQNNFSMPQPQPNPFPNSQWNSGPSAPPLPNTTTMPNRGPSNLSAGTQSESNHSSPNMGAAAVDFASALPPTWVDKPPEPKKGFMIKFGWK